MQRIDEPRADTEGRGHTLLVEELQRLTRGVVQIALHSLRAADHVTLPQMRLLLATRDRGAISGLELAEAAGTSPASVSRHADKLVRSGFLVRQDHPDNRRVVRFSLTPAGQDAVDCVLEERSATFAALIAHLDDEEAAEAARSLSRVFSRVGT